MTPGVRDMADQAEAESIRRFRQLRELLQTVDEAFRRAEAHSRLERAIHDGFRSASTGARTAGRLAGWAR